jgi:hypothetical protein
MRSLFLFVTVMTTWIVSGQSFDRFKLADTDLPQGYKFTNKILCQAVQPRIFFENPDLYQAILGKVRNKDFQSFESKDGWVTLGWQKADKRAS